MSGMRIFELFGIPVYLTLWFVIIVVMWVVTAGSLHAGMLWGACVTFSVLVHEFGHGLVARHYRLSPSIFLHGFGGMCAHEHADHDRHDALIIAAGPLAGLALGLMVLAASALITRFAPEMAANPTLVQTFNLLLLINIFWTFVNCLPLWPLDGGQLLRLALVRWMHPARGERIAHIVGTLCGVGCAILAYRLMGTLAAFMAGYCAWLNYQRINVSSASGPIRPRNLFAEELLDSAHAALAHGNWREAARLGHQIRSLTTLTEAVLAETWSILAIATTELGAFEEALRYAGRAPETPPVVAATVSSLLGLGRLHEAAEALDTPGGRQLPSEARAHLARAIANAGGPLVPA